MTIQPNIKVDNIYESLPPLLSPHSSHIKEIPSSIEEAKTNLVDFVDRIGPLNLTAELAEVDYIVNEFESRIPVQVNQLEKGIELEKLQNKQKIDNQAGSPLIPEKKKSNRLELDFLEAVLPNSIFQNPHLKGNAKGYLRFEWGEALMRASDSDFHILTVIYKSKILKAAHRVLNEIKLSNKDFSKDPSILQAIKEWEIKLVQEEEKIKTDALKYGVKIAGYASPYFKTLFKFFPFPAIIRKSTESIGLMGSAGSILGLLLARINFKQKSQSTKTYQKWVEQFQNWQKLPNTILEKQPHYYSVKQPPEHIFVRQKKFEKELRAIFEKQADIDQIRKDLATFDIELPPTIETKEQLHIHWVANKKLLLAQYTGFQRTFSNLKHIVETSQSLLERRKATAKLKVLKLRPKFKEMLPQLKEHIQKPQIADLLKQKLFSRFNQEYDSILNNASKNSLENIKSELGKIGLSLSSKVETKEAAIKFLSKAQLHPAKMNQMFIRWLIANPHDELLISYIDHQETIAMTVKNSLVNLVNKKHKVEGILNSWKMTHSRIIYGLVAIGSAITAVFGLAALLSNPISGSILILYYLSYSITGASFGIMAVGMLLNNKYKKNAPKFLETMKLTFMTIYTNLKEYEHVSKQKKFIHTAKVVHQLHHQSKILPDKYYKALAEYKKAKSEFETSQGQLEHWMLKVQELENQLTQRAWKDFARYADLETDGGDDKKIDTFKLIQEAIKNLDLDLLDPQIKSFFEVQLGINLETLQREMDQFPDALKNALHHFFSLDEERLVSFINYQQARINEGLLKT
ncbi:MAG: hypothetical protein H0W88_12310 [Parachlamydiaceae bacterium]|nr:hypothetical protein [Parachlamydiaceae bacterium]